eukprot:SAG22_NODE_1464_length_4358_cov_537.962902_3_plen_707_part_00
MPESTSFARAIEKFERKRSQSPAPERFSLESTSFARAIEKFERKRSQSPAPERFSRAELDRTAFCCGAALGALAALAATNPLGLGFCRDMNTSPAVFAALLVVATTPTTASPGDIINDGTYNRTLRAKSRHGDRSSGAPQCYFNNMSYYNDDTCFAGAQCQSSIIFTFDNQGGTSLGGKVGNIYVPTQPFIVEGANGTVYYNDENFIRAVQQGRLKWTFQQGQGNLPSVGQNGVIYAVGGCTNDGSCINAIKPEDGKLKWSYKLAYGSSNRPLVGSDNTVYVLDSGDNPSKITCTRCTKLLHAINADGTHKWDFEVEVGGGGVPIPYDFPSEILTAPLAMGPDGTIYVGSSTAGRDMVTHGHLFAVTPEGKLKWKLSVDPAAIDVPGATHSYGVALTIAVGRDGTVYSAVGPCNTVFDVCKNPLGGVIAVKPEDGKLKWSYFVGDCEPFCGFINVQVGTDGTIYVGSPHRLHALTPAGTLKWTFGVPADVVTFNLGVDGAIYLLTMAPEGIWRQLYVLTADGKMKWHFMPDQSAIPDQRSVNALMSLATIGTHDTILLGFQNQIQALRLTCTSYRCQNDTCIEAPSGASQAGCEAMCGAQPPPPSPPSPPPSPPPGQLSPPPPPTRKVVTPATIIASVVGLALGTLIGAVGAMVLRGGCCWLLIARFCPCAQKYERVPSRIGSINDPSRVSLLGGESVSSSIGGSE